MNILDNIYITLFKPKSAFADLVNREYLPGAFFIIALLSIFGSFENAISFNISGWAFGILILLSISLYFFIWILSSLFLTFTADFLGGAGKITDTMTGLAYALLPLIFIAPLYVLTNTMGDPGQDIYSVLKWVIYIWTTVLIIISLKHSHRFHITQAILSIVSIFGLIIILTAGTLIISGLGIILGFALLA